MAVVLVATNLDCNLIRNNIPMIDWMTNAGQKFACSRFHDIVHKYQQKQQLSTWLICPDQKKEQLGNQERDRLELFYG